MTEVPEAFLKAKFEIYKMPFVPVINKYTNGRIRIDFVCSEDGTDDTGCPFMRGEPVAVLTVNLPDEPLEEGEFFVKDWSENRPIAAIMSKSGFFEIDEEKGAISGYEFVNVWRFKKETAP